MSPTIAVRKLVQPSESMIEQSVKVLHEAFLEDQFTKVVTGGASNVIEALKRAQLHSGLEGGEVWVAEESSPAAAEEKKIVGCAVWFGPGRAMFDTDEQKKNLIGPVFAQIDPEIKKWWGDYFMPTYGALTTASFGLVPNPSGPGEIPYKLAAWHLQTIGVLPSHRKRGITRAFIDALKEKVTTEGKDKGVPLCLEAINEANSIIYSRLGFVHRGEGDFVGARPDLGGFHFWCMVWEEGQQAAEKTKA
jgi:GNAT superfamily N-acetyltransferase